MGGKMQQIEFTYPINPGWKGTQTSKDAAVEKKSTKKLDYKKVLAALEANPTGLTADEIASFYGEVFIKYRPRCSELKKLGKIEPTGDKRPSQFGNNQDVLRLK